MQPSLDERCRRLQGLDCVADDRLDRSRRIGWTEDDLRALKDGAGLILDDARDGDAAGDARRLAAQSENQQNHRREQGALMILWRTRCVPQRLD